MEAAARKSDFGIGNIALISLVAVVLFLMAWHQRPLQFKGQSSDAAVLTLQPQPKLLAQAGSSQVLGAATYNKDFAKQFSNIPIQISQENSVPALQNYAFQVITAVENDRLSDKNPQHELKFLADISRLAVPNVSELQDYQRLLIAYYQLDYAQSSGQLAAAQSNAVGQVKEQLDLIRSDVQTNYQLQLP